MSNQPTAIVARRPCGCVERAIANPPPKAIEFLLMNGLSVVECSEAEAFSQQNAESLAKCPHGTTQQQLAALVRRQGEEIRNAREGALKICRVAEETMRVSDTPKSPTTMAFEALTALRKIDTIADRISKGEQT